MLHESARLSIAFAAGAAMGAVYLVVLWATVRRATMANHPAALLLASAALRIGLMLAGWYWIADGRWDGLAACLLGFLGARLVATRLVARGGPEQMKTS